LIASTAIGQSLPETTSANQEFHSSSVLISHQTHNTYKLVRIGSNNYPSILSVNKSAITRKLSAADRNDIAAVRIFAGNEASYIAANALALPITASLVETGTLKTGKLWLSSYTATYGGIPLRERFLRINIGAQSGEVMLVRNSIPSKNPNSLSAKIEPAQITEKTTELLGTHAVLTTAPQLVLIDEKDNPQLRLCFEVVVRDPDMYEEWRLTFDALTGDLLEKRSLVEQDCFLTSGEVVEAPHYKNNISDGTVSVLPENSPEGASGRIFAKVHLQSPYDTLTTVGVPHAFISVNGVFVEADSTGFWSVPTATYPLSLQTSFNSPYFSVIRQDMKPGSVLQTMIASGNADVLWSDTNSDPAERDAYYSAARAHMADKRVDEGLKNIDLHMKVNVNMNSVCNAFYIPSDTSINFFMAGSGCANTAEISDVVFHEYGHRVTNARYQQAAGRNTNIYDGSLSEGFADLNSAFIRDDPRIGIGFFGNPDSNGGRVIRSCDNTKKWPRDINHDIHVSGEIISGAFWDLRELIGRDSAEHLFHFTEYEMPDGPGLTDSASLEDAFAATLASLILTDDDDNDLANGTPHLAQILAAFKLHNITLLNFLNLDAGVVQDQDSSANGYRVQASAYYNGVVGSLDMNSVKTYYSVDNGQSYRCLVLANDSLDQFSAKIPKVPAGTIVRYYTSAANTMGDTVYFPSPAAAYHFLVGFKRIFFDDAEKDNGWSLSASTDSAVKGVWVRDKPNGTFNYPYTPIRYIQQDTDHTQGGTICFVTGNHTDPSGSNNCWYDDVDSGTTTLTTPILNVSKTNSPYIRFWYYYSNDKGPFPRSALWKTDISDDDGLTWHSLQSTFLSTNGPTGYPQWTEFSFRLKDYCNATSAVKIRFIASDRFGSLVEAGVDDLEILDQVVPESGVAGVLPSTSLLPYPNPIRRGERLHLDVQGQVVLTDLLGRTVVQFPQTEDGCIIPATITPGIYFMESGTHRFKIVVAE
jgi:hypothetical protein